MVHGSLVQCRIERAFVPHAWPRLFELAEQTVHGSSNEPDEGACIAAGVVDAQRAAFVAYVITSLA